MDNDERIDYGYTPWEDSIHSKIGNPDTKEGNPELFELLIQKLYPDLMEFVKYQESEIAKRHRNDNQNRWWKGLEIYTEDARKALEKGGERLTSQEISGLAMTFYKLGRSAQHLSDLREEFVKTALRSSLKGELSQLAEEKRKLPLQLKNANRSLRLAILKGMARATASQLWEQDAESSIRISEMSDMVYRQVTALLHRATPNDSLCLDEALKVAEIPDSEREEFVASLWDHMPGDPSGIKNWIKPIANNYPHAQKRGRPPKKK